MPAPDDRILRFAEFAMDRDSLELRRDGQRIRLQIQPFRVLEILVERAGQVVTREDFRSRLWPSKVYVDFDHGLNNAVARLREALGDSAEHPRFIETLPRIGYRFVIPAEHIRGAAPETTVAADSGALAPGSQGPSTPIPAGSSSSDSSHRRRNGAVWMLVVAALGLLLVVLQYTDSQSGPGSAPIGSIAVLPVRNLTGDAQQDHLAAGLTEALVTQLAQLSSLRVVPRRSAERFRDAAIPLADIARELDVDGVIDGALMRHDDRLRVDVQLVAAAANQLVWARSYDRSIQDFFRLQREIADQIATRISSTGHVDGLSVSVPHSNSIEAYELYLQGRHLWNQRSPDSVTRSLDFFERAIDLDPRFAAAHAGLAEAYALLGGNSLVKIRAVEELREPALAAAREALRLDGNLAEAHCAMARALNLQPDPAALGGEIESHYRRALALNPASSDARLAYGNFLSARGRQSEAVEHFRLALIHDPLSSNNLSRLGKELVDTGHAEEGIALLERAVEIEPWQFNAQLRLAWTYAAFGRYDEAIGSFERAEQISPGTIHTVAGLAFVAARRGDVETANRHLAMLTAQADTIDVPFLLAVVYVAMRDRENALVWLQKAAPGSATLVRDGLYGLTAPMYDWLRDDPRFQSILQMAGKGRADVDS